MKPPMDERLVSLAVRPDIWPGWQCVAPIPTTPLTTVSGRPAELWEVVYPLDVTATGRRHHLKVELLLGTEYGVPRAWRRQFRTKGQVDQGPHRTVLARQVLGRQPGYVVHVDTDRLTIEGDW